MTQQCTKCLQEKELTSFNQQSGTKTGYKYICKQCIKEYNTVRYDKNKRKIKRQVIAWQSNNQDKIRNYKREWKQKQTQLPIANPIVETPPQESLSQN